MEDLQHEKFKHGKQIHITSFKNFKDNEEGRTVEVSVDVLNQLHSAHYFSKKKGNALFMLSASKELGTIKRNKKKSFRQYDFYKGEKEMNKYVSKGI